MRGFTLVEMLVVLVLASLMLMLVPPLFSGSVARVNFESQADKIAMSLRRARSQSIARSEPVPWILDVEEHLYQIGDEGKTRKLDEDIQLSFTTSLSETLEQGKKAAIRFYPDGGATGGNIRMQLDQYSKTVVIDWLTGRVHVE